MVAQISLNWVTAVASITAGENVRSAVVEQALDVDKLHMALLPAVCASTRSDNCKDAMTTTENILRAIESYAGLFVFSMIDSFLYAVNPESNK
jgi:hypothetical protein